MPIWERARRWSFCGARVGICRFSTALSALSDHVPHLPDLVLEHIHTEDVASAIFALAQWQLKQGSRAASNAKAGAPLPPCRPSQHSEAKPTPSSPDVREIEGLAKRDSTVTAPIFNITDGAEQTQGDLGKVLQEAMGIKVDYVSCQAMSIAAVASARYWLTCAVANQHSTLTNALAKVLQYAIRAIYCRR